MHDNKHHGYRPVVAAPVAREALVISLLYWGPVRTVRPVRCFYGPASGRYKCNHHLQYNFMHSVDVGEVRLGVGVGVKPV